MILFVRWKKKYSLSTSTFASSASLFTVNIFLYRSQIFPPDKATEHTTGSTVYGHRSFLSEGASGKMRRGLWVGEEVYSQPQRTTPKLAKLNRRRIDGGGWEGEWLPGWWYVSNWCKSYTYIALFGSSPAE